MKANGIHPQGGISNKRPSTSDPRESSQAAIARSAAAKRRKIEGDDADCNFDEEEEDDVPRPPKEEPKPEYAQNKIIKLENINHEATFSSSPFSHIPMLGQPSAYYPQSFTPAYAYSPSCVSPYVSLHIPRTQNLIQLVDSSAFHHIPNSVHSADLHYTKAIDSKAAVAKLNAPEDLAPAMTTTQFHDPGARSGKGPCESILIPD